MSTTAARIGFRIKVNKRKVVSSYLQDDKIHIFINSLSVEEVPDFKYLGPTLIPNGQAEGEITTRIMVARNVSDWQNPYAIVVKNKMRLYVAAIQSCYLAARCTFDHSFYGFAERIKSHMTISILAQIPSALTTIKKSLAPVRTYSSPTTELRTYFISC